MGERMEVTPHYQPWPHKVFIVLDIHSFVPYQI